MLDFRLGSKADVTLSNFDVRFSPESGHRRRHWDVRFVPLAEVGQLHSITSSAAVAFAERDYLNASSSIVG